MTPLVAHPEALIELHRQGQLSAAARSELAAHLEQCSACAGEVWAQAVLVRECDPLIGDAELNRLAVQATLAKLAAQPVRAQRPRRAWVWALAAALPLCAFAALSPWLARHETRDPRLASASAAPVAPPEQWPPAPQVAPSAVPSASASVPQPNASPALSGSRDSLGPSELLRRAGDLEREGKRAPALAVYRELQKRFAASAEAQLSHVLVGSLLLAQGKSRPALAQFDRYLAGSGPASEDALAGRAAALHSLGEQAAEAATWRRLLGRFPHSVHASQARKRLAALAPDAAPPKSL